MLKFGSKNDVNSVIKVSVRLLDDSEMVECDIQPHCKGKYLLDHVCNQLNLIEVDYFGLRFTDSHKIRHWLDPSKNIMKQLKDVDPLQFSFRVKFYPPDPFKLKEDITRYQIYLQLKRDLLHGRLYCDPNAAAQLGAYILQEELGDFNPEEHVGNYVSELKILLKQTTYIEEKMIEFHSKLVEQTPEQVETAFLRKAACLDTYGVDPQPVKDHAGNQMYLGINHTGILTFLGNRRTTRYLWKQVQNINYEGKMFIVHLVFYEDPRTKRKETVGFKCDSGLACRLVWRAALEQKLFFTCVSSSQIPPVLSGGGLFSWGGGAKFKYQGRVQLEIMEDLSALKREEPRVTRTHSLRRKPASVPATPSTPVPNESSGYSSLPRSNYSTDFRSPDGLGVGGSHYSGSECTNTLETVAEDAESARQRLQDHPDNSSEYTVRDSSCEQLNSISYIGSTSGAVLPGGVGSSRRSTPINNIHTSTVSSVSYPPLPSHSSITSRSLVLSRIFLNALLLATLLVLVATVLVFETDLNLLSPVKRTPEMMLLRREFYEPCKKYVRSKLTALYQGLG
uniref:Moesin/ezrin/radixin homolog 1 n=3 Tax=Cacopsylla melanoneura TaxID=428564 RepID=A0A8D8USL1_9HEMI